jgi:hypothetical protein
MDEPVTIERAVDKYLADSKARELGEATLYKLNISFRKQLLAWSKAEGYKLLLELQLDSSKRLRFSGLFGDGNSVVFRVGGCNRQTLFE